MSAEPEPSPPARRRARAASLVLVLALGASLPSWWGRTYAATLEGGADGAIYLVCARSLLRGEGYAYLGEPFIVRPPGFSVLMAPVLAAFGTNETALTAIPVASAILAVAALLFLLAPRVGVATALAGALFLWLNPAFRHFSNQVMSDVPGLAAMLGCLLLERRVARARSAWAQVGLGVAVAAAASLRTVNALLVPAILLGRAFGDGDPWRPRGAARTPRASARWAFTRLVPFVAAVALALLPWSLRNARHTPEGAVEHSLLHSYSVAQWHTDPGDPHSPRIGLTELAERVETRGRDVLGVLGSRLQRTRATASDAALALAALVAWAVALAARRRTEDWLLGGILAVTLIYFGFMPRLVLPILVLAVGPAAEGLSRLGRIVGPRTAAVLPVAALLVLAAFDWRPLRDARWRTLERSWATLQDVARRVERRFPPHAALSSSDAPHLYWALDRPVLSHRWSFLRGGAEAARDFLERHAVEGVVLEANWAGDRALGAALEDDPRVRELGRVGIYRLLSIAR